MALIVVWAKWSHAKTRRREGGLFSGTILSGHPVAVAETKKLVDTGQTKAAQDAFDALKANFPGIAGPDLDAFIKGELYFCRGKYVKAAKSHDKLLTDYPRSPLREAALDRQFAIARPTWPAERRRCSGSSS